MSDFNNFDLHFIFELKSDRIQFLNAQYIHPLKQDLVQKLQEIFINDSNVKAAIIFGSAVEFRCHSSSDLNLCIERYDVGKYFHHDCDEVIDLLYWDRLGDRIRKEIAEKGIVVFDREQKYKLNDRLLW